MRPAFRHFPQISLHRRPMLTRIGHVLKTLLIVGVYNQDVVAFQGSAGRVTLVSMLGGGFLQWNFFWGDFKFIRVQIGCEGWRHHGKMGRTHARDIGLPEVHAIRFIRALYTFPHCMCMQPTC